MDPICLGLGMAVLLVAVLREVARFGRGLALVTRRWRSEL